MKSSGLSVSSFNGSVPVFLTPTIETLKPLAYSLRDTTASETPCKGLVHFLNCFGLFDASTSALRVNGVSSVVGFELPELSPDALAAEGLMFVAGGELTALVFSPLG